MTIFFKSYTEIQDELHCVSIIEVIFVQTKTTFRNKMHIVMICRLIVKSVKLTTFNFDRFCGLHPFWPQCLCVSWCNVHSLCCSHGCCIATNYESMINFIRWDASTNMVRLAGQILPYRIHCHPVRKGECLSLQITYTQEVMNKSSTISTTIRVHHITTSG